MFKYSKEILESIHPCIKRLSEQQFLFYKTLKMHNSCKEFEKQYSEIQTNVLRRTRVPSLGHILSNRIVGYTNNVYSYQYTISYYSICCIRLGDFNF